ncbi:hypothetical protein N577_003530 [Lacticaseibacillus rhamnosus 2166]|nr:hypothetical protein N577_003530 [Lacticaseibacillus rhamnosus 2166]
MNFIIDPKVLALGVKIRGVELTGIDNHHYPQALKQAISTEIATVLETLNRDQIKQDPIIQAFGTCIALFICLSATTPRRQQHY